MARAPCARCRRRGLRWRNRRRQCPNRFECRFPPPAPVQADANLRDGDGDRAGVSGAPRRRPPAPPLARSAGGGFEHSGIHTQGSARRSTPIAERSTHSMPHRSPRSGRAQTSTPWRVGFRSCDTSTCRSNRCQTRVTAADRALVSCDGSISDVLNSGDPTPAAAGAPPGRSPCGVSQCVGRSRASRRADFDARRVPRSRRFGPRPTFASRWIACCSIGDHYGFG
jgi:hypothetical protein